MPFQLSTWKSCYERSKEVTLDVKKYLVEDSAEVLGRDRWQARFVLDIAKINYDSVSAQANKSSLRLQDVSGSSRCGYRTAPIPEREVQANKHRGRRVREAFLVASALH